MAGFRTLRALPALALALSTIAGNARGQTARNASMPQLHHVGLNSVDPARAIEWYLKV